MPPEIPGEAVWRLWNTRKPFSGRSPPRTPLGSLQRSPNPLLVWKGLASFTLSTNFTLAVDPLALALRTSPLIRNRSFGPSQHDELDPPLQHSESGSIDTTRHFCHPSFLVVVAAVVSLGITVLPTLSAYKSTTVPSRPKPIKGH